MEDNTAKLGQKEFEYSTGNMKELAGIAIFALGRMAIQAKRNGLTYAKDYETFLDELQFISDDMEKRYCAPIIPSSTEKEEEIPSETAFYMTYDEFEKALEGYPLYTLGRYLDTNYLIYNEEFNVADFQIDIAGRFNSGYVTSLLEADDIENVDEMLEVLNLASRLANTPIDHR